MSFDLLRDYQRPHATHLLKVLKTNRAALDGSDTGTGKTFVACAIAKAMGVVPRVLCPLSVTESWKRAGAYVGVDLEVTNYEKARGVSRRVNYHHPKIFGPNFRRHTESDLGVEVHWAKGSSWQWKSEVELAIFDEVDRCGGATSLHSKMLIAARRQFRHLLLLSATAASEPQHLKALGFALGLFELKGFKWWMLKHGCEPGVFGGIVFSDDPEEQERAMLKIHKALYPARGSRLRKSEIPGFPPTQIDVLMLEDTTGRAAKIAEKIRDTYGKEKHLEQYIKSRQALELLKVEHLTELAENYSATNRVAVFLNFTKSIDALATRLQKVLGKEVGIIDGRNTANRDATAQRFQRHEIPAVAVNSQAGGVGLNLHALSDYAAFISTPDRPRLVKQVLGRGNRDGGGFSQQFFVYFAGTVEEDIAARVQQANFNMDLLNDGELVGCF
jgi:superfamily II DNA or RNA helicase